MTEEFVLNASISEVPGSLGDDPTLRFLTLTEVTKRTGLSYTAQRAAISRGELKTVLIGRREMISEAALA